MKSKRLKIGVGLTILTIIIGAYYLRMSSLSFKDKIEKLKIDYLAGNYNMALSDIHFNLSEKQKLDKRIIELKNKLCNDKDYFIQKTKSNIESSIQQGDLNKAQSLIDEYKYDGRRLGQSDYRELRAAYEIFFSVKSTNPPVSNSNEITMKATEIFSHREGGKISKYPRGKPRGIKSAASKEAAQALALVRDDVEYTW